MIKLLLTFLLTLSAGLLAYAPADKIIPRVLPESLGVQLFEISGTLLNGQAGHVRRQALGVDNVAWDLQLSHLLLGRLTADLKVSFESRDLETDNSWLIGRVSRSLFSNSIRLSDLEAVTPLEALQGPLKLAFLPVTGLLQAQFDELELQDNRPTVAEGALQFSAARWMLGKPAELGDFSASISTTDEQIQATVADLDSGKVDVDGLAQLGPSGEWTFNGKVKPKADTPSPVANAMKALGRTDQQGWYEISRKGQLPAP